MKPSDVFSLILIAVVIVDIVLMRVEVRRLRDYKRSTSSSSMEIEMTCDNSDFLAKMDQSAAAARRTAEAIAEVTRAKMDER